MSSIASDDKLKNAVKELGIEGEDFLIIKDGNTFVAVKYIDALQAKEAANVGDTSDPMNDKLLGFISKHVAYPESSEVVRRIQKRPFLGARLYLAIMELYGNASEFELGKAEFSRLAT